MGNLMTSFNAGVSGLHAAQASLNTTSHNLANAQTTGYVRQQTIVTDSFYQTNLGMHDDMLQVGTGTAIVKTRQIRNEFLDAKYRLQLGRQNFYEQNEKTVYEIEDMMGELHGEEFRTSIADLKAALSTLSENPDSIVNKDQIVSIAQQFVQRAQVLWNELSSYQTSLNDEVSRQVDQVNSLVSQIRDYNKKIQKYEAQDSRPTITGTRETSAWMNLPPSLILRLMKVLMGPLLYIQRALICWTTAISIIWRLRMRVKLPDC